MKNPKRRHFHMESYQNTLVRLKNEIKKKKVKWRHLLGFNKIPFFPFFLFFPRVLSPATLLPLLHKPRPDFTPSLSLNPIAVA
jgi:hypothetical protein